MHSTTFILSGVTVRYTYIVSPLGKINPDDAFKKFEWVIFYLLCMLSTFSLVAAEIDNHTNNK